MRIKLTLQCEPGTKLPMDTHYPLSSAIYHLLAKSDPEYATFLHNEGYRGEKRRYKPFTFSWLYARKRYPDRTDSTCQIIYSKTMEWYLTSPLDEFIQNIVTGFFEAGGVRIYNRMFPIKTIETLAEPQFSNAMIFTCFSPFVVSTKDDRDRIVYFKEDGPDLDQALTNNIKSKYELLYDTWPEGALRLEIPMPVKKKRKYLTKTITIRPGQHDETTLVGIMTPFRLTGPTDLIRLAYTAGLGEHTAQGCGMMALTDSGKEKLFQ